MHGACFQGLCSRGACVVVLVFKGCVRVCACFHVLCSRGACVVVLVSKGCVRVVRV